MSLLQSVIDVLKTPVPLPEILVKPIEIPAFRAPSIGKKSSRKRKTKIQAMRKSSPDAGNFVMEGILEHGSNTLFAVNNVDLFTTPDTWVFGELRVGCHARIKGAIVAGERQCTSIVVSP